MASAQANRTMLGLLKRGWHEIPEVIGSTAVAFIGLGLCAVGLRNYYANDGDNRRYKLTYVVMRPDDPRAANIRKD